VLQKHKEEHKGRSFAILLLRLDGHPEQFSDEYRLSQAVASLHSLNLPFSHHIHDLVSL